MLGLALWRCNLSSVERVDLFLHAHMAEFCPWMCALGIRLPESKGQSVFYYRQHFSIQDWDVSL